jgi:RecA-family ATPase
MPRRALSVLRTTEQMINEIELAAVAGKTVSSDVLQLCKLYRAAEKTIRAQQEVIIEHARTIAGKAKKG